MFSSSAAAQHAQRWEPLWAAGLQPGELSVHCYTTRVCTFAKGAGADVPPHRSFDAVRRGVRGREVHRVPLLAFTMKVETDYNEEC